MLRFLHSRLLRCIICFCLICCIFVNCSPIRTKALVPESILVGAGIVIGSIMLGLGVGMGQDSTQQVLTNLVNDCVDIIKSDYDFIDEDALVHVYADYSAGTAQYYASQELVEAVQTWLFESETISYDPGGNVSDVSCWFPSVTVDAFGKKYVYTGITDDQFFSPPVAFRYSDIGSDGKMFYCIKVGFLTNVAGVYCNGIYEKLSTSTTYSGFYGEFRSATCHEDFFDSWDLWNQYPFSCVDLGLFNLNEGTLSFFLDSAIANSKIDSSFEVSVDGIALGYVSNPDDDLPTGYPVWSGGAISIPGSTVDDEERIGYPIGIADTLEGTLNLSQEDVWAGNSSYTDTKTDTNTGTDTEIDTTSKTLSQLITEVKNGTLSITDALAEVVAAVKAVPAEVAEATKAEVTTDLDSLSLDLKDFFPFCIPFDLYAFFGCLNAAPEAPVFELALPTPIWQVFVHRRSISL